VAVVDHNDAGIVLFEGYWTRKGQVARAFLFGLGRHMDVGIFALQKGYNFGVMFTRPVFRIDRKGPLAFYFCLNLAGTTFGAITLREESAHLSSLGERFFLHQTKKEMPLYKLRRHVVWKPGCQETVEAWGIDRPAPGLRSRCAPTFTDADDPLRGSCNTQLLTFCDGAWVTWPHITEWMSEAEEAGYTVVSGFENLSPYSTIVIRGP